jgi:hypothetical protein
MVAVKVEKRVSECFRCLDWQELGFGNKCPSCNAFADRSQLAKLPLFKDANTPQLAKWQTSNALVRQLREQGKCVGPRFNCDCENCSPVFDPYRFKRRNG